MRRESLGKFLFVSQHLGGFIGIFLAAFIASNRQVSGKRRPRREGIGLPKRDSMPIKKIRLMMKSLVFADYHPAVLIRLPHARLHEDTTNSGRG
jgi:hypothetical protein